MPGDPIATILIPNTYVRLLAQEFEDHAEKLRAVETSSKPPDIDAVTRAEMQRKVKDDPFVRAVLIGMAEDPFVHFEQREQGEQFATD